MAGEADELREKIRRYTALLERTTELESLQDLRSMIRDLRARLARIEGGGKAE